ncbi:hypothetical protein JZX88_06220 [Agrobacterium sp. OT33]|nr:hypothetical protein [Agrobacterium sp. OT33]
MASAVNVSMSGLQIVDGVQTEAGDRVLLTNQTSDVDNGIYIVDIGPWKRSPDFNKTRDLVKGTRVWVVEGDSGPAEMEVSSENPVRIGIDSIYFNLSAGSVNAAALAEAVREAEAARDIAAGYASDAVSQGNVPIYATVVGMPSLEIPIGINAIRVNGYYAAGDGGGALYVKVDDEPVHAGKFQTADGAWWEIAESQVNDRMFGSKADYVIGGSGHDDTAAIQAAWLCAVAQGKRELHFYGEEYRLVTGTMGGEVIKLVGHGKPKIVAKNMSGLNVFNMQVVSEVGVVGGAVGMEFIVEGENVGRFIATPVDSSQYFTYYVTYEFRGNYCHGANRITEKYSFAWDYSAAAWFHVGDCNGALFLWNNIQGAFDIKVDPAGQFEDVGILLDANSAILSARIHDNNIGPIWQGIRVEDRAFLTMSDNDIIGAYDGLYFVTGSLLLNEPKVQRNNFNAQRYGIYLDGPDSIELVDNTIRRHSAGWKGATHNWFGIYAANVSDLKLSHNTVQPDESGGVYSGTKTAYGLVACGLSVALGNFVGVGNSIGFGLDNCTGLVINDTVTAQNGGADVLFNLVNNTRRSVIGNYALVSSWAGTVLAKDASIIGNISMLNESFDLQGSGNVQIDMTRSSAPADQKKWRTVVGANSMSRQAVNDAGSGTNFEIVTRSGSTVTQLEWRASAFKFNNGPTLTFSAASPEGIVAAPTGSLHINTSATGRLYVKESGTGNTGWVVVGTQP